MAFKLFDPHEVSGIGQLRKLVDELSGMEAPESWTLALIDRVDETVLDHLASNSERIAVVLSKKSIPSRDLLRLADAGVDEVLLETSGVKSQLRDRLRVWVEVDQLASSPLAQRNLLGRSVSWQRLVRQTAQIALHGNGPVLIDGETGTGKELVSRFIHTVRQSIGERKGRMIIVDATTIVPTLSGSELFGHEKGAFTGADQTRKGAFELANEGSVFLDEVGELPLALQAELLRVIQERTVRRVGGNDWIETDFDLTCATNKDIKAMVTDGTFRSDLYHRISSAVLKLPPLRDRSGDVEVLAEHFVSNYSKGLCTMDSLVTQVLRDHEWPGNVRELENVCRFLVMSRGGSGLVTPGDLPPALSSRATIT